MIQGHADFSSISPLIALLLYFVFKLLFTSSHIYNHNPSQLSLLPVNCFFLTGPVLLHVCMRRPEVDFGCHPLLSHTVVISKFLKWFSLCCLGCPWTAYPRQRLKTCATTTPGSHIVLRHFLLNLEYITVSPGWADQPVLEVLPSVSCVGTTGTHCYTQLLCGCWAPHPGSHDTAAISRLSSGNFLNTQLTVICCLFLNLKFGTCPLESCL